MGAFEYTALDRRGREQRGILEGDTPRQVRQQLRDKGWLPLGVEEVAAQLTAGGKPRRRGRLNGTDLALFTRQVATLARAGLPLEEALRAVAQQTDKPRAKSVVMGVRARVLEGHSLAAALAEFPHAFPDLYRATVSAGEQSGYLDAVLERLADYTEARQQTGQKVALALVYPALVSSVALLVVVALLTYVVPQVVQVFQGVGQTLPIMTRSLIAASDFLQHYGLWLLVVLVLAGLGFGMLLRRESFRHRVHRWQLRLPFVSRLVRGVNAARFARTLSILAASGVPVLEALRIAARVLGNLPMRAAVLEAERRVSEGTSIHAALEQSGLFPPMTVQLIASGEATGNLEGMLERAASSQERELDTLVATLLSLLEPFMILFMGGVVLYIVVAILLPIFDLNRLIR